MSHPPITAEHEALAHRVARACLELAERLEDLIEVLTTPPAVATPSSPADDAAGPVTPPAAEGPDPTPSGTGEGSGPSLDHPAIAAVADTLRLRIAIRTALNVLWPGDQAHQATWLRSYLTPRGHPTLGLATLTLDELQRLADHLETLVDVLRWTGATPDPTARPAR